MPNTNILKTVLQWHSAANKLGKNQIYWLVKSKVKNCQNLPGLASINETLVNISAPRVTNTNDNFPCPLTNYLRLSFSYVDQSIVLEFFLSVKSNAAWMDGIYPVCLKAVLPIPLPCITHCFNMIITLSIFPKRRKAAIFTDP